MRCGTHKSCRMPLASMSASTDGASGHGSGMCSLSYIVQGQTIRLVTCGADGKVVLRDADRPEATFVTASAVPPAPMTCLAVRPDGSAVVVGDAQDAKNFVKVWLTSCCIGVDIHPKDSKSLCRHGVCTGDSNGLGTLGDIMIAGVQDAGAGV